MVIDLDDLYIGELLEVEHQRTGNGVECAIRLAGTLKIHKCDTIGIFQFAVTSKTIKDEGKTFITLHIAGTFEELVQDPTDQIF